MCSMSSWSTSRRVEGLSVDEFVKSEQPRLARLDVLDEAGHAGSFLVKSARLEPIGGDEDERR
jgi:hypothetical protein